MSSSESHLSDSNNSNIGSVNATTDNCNSSSKLSSVEEKISLRTALMSQRIIDTVIARSTEKLASDASVDPAILQKLRASWMRNLRDAGCVPIPPPIIVQPPLQISPPLNNQIAKGVTSASAINRNSSVRTGASQPTTSSVSASALSPGPARFASPRLTDHLPPVVLPHHHQSQTRTKRSHVRRPSQAGDQFNKRSTTSATVIEEGIAIAVAATDTDTNTSRREKRIDRESISLYSASTAATEDVINTRQLLETQQSTMDSGGIKTKKNSELFISPEQQLILKQMSYLEKSGILTDDFKPMNTYQRKKQKRDRQQQQYRNSYNSIFYSNNTSNFSDSSGNYPTFSTSCSSAASARNRGDLITGMLVQVFITEQDIGGGGGGGEILSTHQRCDTIKLSTELRDKLMALRTPDNINNISSSSNISSNSSSRNSSSSSSSSRNSSSGNGFVNGIWLWARVANVSSLSVLKRKQFNIIEPQQPQQQQTETAGVGATASVVLVNVRLDSIFGAKGEKECLWPSPGIRVNTGDEIAQYQRLREEKRQHRRVLRELRASNAAAVSFSAGLREEGEEEEEEEEEQESEGSKDDDSESIVHSGLGGIMSHSLSAIDILMGGGDVNYEEDDDDDGRYFDDDDDEEEEEEEREAVGVTVAKRGVVGGEMNSSSSSSSSSGSSMLMSTNPAPPLPPLSSSSSSSSSSSLAPLPPLVTLISGEKVSQEHLDDIEHYFQSDQKYFEGTGTVRIKLHGGGKNSSSNSSSSKKNTHTCATTENCSSLVNSPILDDCEDPTVPLADPTCLIIGRLLKLKRQSNSSSSSSSGGELKFNHHNNSASVGGQWIIRLADVYMSDREITKKDYIYPLLEIRLRDTFFFTEDSDEEEKRLSAVVAAAAAAARGTRVGSGVGIGTAGSGVATSSTIQPAAAAAAAAAK